MTELHGIGSLSPEVFARSFMELGKRLGVLEAPSFDASRFAVVDGDEVHALDTTYEAYLTAPQSSRDQLLLGVLAELRGSQRACSLERLLPRLRSSAELDRLSLEPVSAHAPCHWHVAADVYLTVVLDGDEVMTTVSHEMLRAWGRDGDEVRRRAQQNLSRASGGALTELAPGLWIGPWDDAYAASRLLVAAELAPCPGAVFCVPSRDTLFAVDPGNVDALATLMTLVERISDAEHPISAELFRLRDGQLAVYRPEEQGVALRHHNLLRRLQVERYAEQLRRLQPAVGPEVHVARAELDETQGGELIVRALWTEGAATLLPEVDRLHLLSTAADGTSSRILSASFGDVLALPGVLSRTEQLLPRYLPRRFPSDEELAKIAVPVSRDEATLSLR